jgi:hypothetical protein
MVDTAPSISMAASLIHAKAVWRRRIGVKAAENRPTSRDPI